MKPTETLRSEHRVIEDMLEITRAAAQKLAQGERVDPEVFEKAVDFFRNFADQCHHHKEERHLFELLVEKGVPKEGGPVGAMLIEHELGRTHVRGMAEAVARLKAGPSDPALMDQQAVKDLVGHATAYVDLLSNHIRKEDGVLYPLADRVLSPEEQHELEETFARVEAEEMGEGVHEKYHHLVHELSDRLS